MVGGAVQGDGAADGPEEGGGDSSLFAFFALEGDRFDAPGMPVEALRELSAYRTGLVEIATDLWKRENPDRIRVPGGFAAAFDLRLTDVAEGSVRPQMHLSRPARGVTETEWEEWSPYYGRARDLATAAVGDAAEAGVVPSEVSDVVKKAVGRLGVSLGPGDRLRLGDAAPTGRRAVLDQRVRAVLRQIDEVLPPAPRPASAVGVLSEYDGEHLSFILRSGDDRITCLLEHFNEGLSQRAREYLALDGITAPDVRVEGETLDDDRLARIYNVHTLEIVWTVAEKIYVHRLRSLTDLGGGWLGPGSDAPTAEMIARLEPLSRDLAALAIPVTVVANADGAVVLEWRRGDVEYTAAVEPSGSLFLCADNVTTDALAETEVPFDADLLRRFLADGAMA